jgi:DNA-directed RNA polymerase specialized sigma24 family protein
MTVESVARDEERSALERGARIRESVPASRSGFGREQRIHGCRKGVSTYPDRLFRAACVMCGSQEDAERLVLETYANAPKGQRSARRDDLGYLLENLRNTMLDSERRRVHGAYASTWVESAEFVIDADADPNVSVDEIRSAYRAVHQLEPALRDTVVAVDIVGLSHKRAARALGTRKRTITERLQSAHEHLAERLPHFSEDSAVRAQDSVAALADTTSARAAS